MKPRNPPPPSAQKIIARAPHLFTDRAELRLAMRAAIVSGDDSRLAALNKRDGQLREQWRAEHAEEIAKADDEVLGQIVNGNPEAAEWLTRQMREHFKTIAQANEGKEAKAELQRFTQEVTRRDNERRRELRGMPFEKSRLATLASSTPRDFAQELGRSENYITDTAKKIGLQKSAGRWVFIQGDAQRDPKRLYDRLTSGMKNGFTTA